MRLEPNREALLVLGLIVVIMLTDFAFDAFRFALLLVSRCGHRTERAWAFIGDALARAVSGAGRGRPGALEAGYRVSSGHQMVVVLSFLVILPLGEHFHIVTALPGPLLQARAARATRCPRSTWRRAMSGEGIGDAGGCGAPALDLARGRRAWTHSPAPSTGAARTPARHSSPASRCR